MELYAGTSGYCYPEWKGPFYPENLPANRMLHFYGEHFRTVEINNTFYRMPKAPVLETWASEVPAPFKFVLKASRRITHVQHLKDAADPLTYLFSVASVLKEHLGPLLFQLPPSFRKNHDRLREFLDLLPPRCQAAFEFRHPSWFAEDVFELLREHGMPLCIADVDKPPEPPFMATAEWGYLRLRRPEYRDADLQRWASLIHQQPWQRAFVFFKHEEAGKGPQLAQRFLDLAA